MKQPFFFVAVAAACSIALISRSEAQAPAPSTPRPPPQAPVISPEVHKDRQVTFRLKAPQSKEITVSGQSIAKTAMTRDENNVWSATVGPVEAGVWEYSFTVDGVQMIDPGNPQLKPQRSPRTSILHIPSEPPQPWDYQEVPHGSVHQHAISSKSLGRMRELVIYTPPGYENATSAKFPVLYLIHGFGDNHATWTAHGKAHWILDSLIAGHKASPMIVVMPDGHPIAVGAGSREDYGRANTEAFDRELIEETIPFVESLYRVRNDATGRAIAGLSMGGGHSLNSGLRHRDLFAWIGAFSAATPGNERVDELLANGEAANRQLKLLWIACGKKDFLVERNRLFDAKLSEKGVRHRWLETEGDHSWPVWRRYLVDFAPLLFKENAAQPAGS